jgi:hypothetical protein
VLHFAEGLGCRSFRAAICSESLPAWTATVNRSNPIFNPRRDLICRSSTSSYIIKENPYYDQVLGDLKRGNGDPS